MSELLQFAIPESDHHERLPAQRTEQFVPQEPLARGLEELDVANKALELSGLNPGLRASMRLMRDMEALSAKTEGTKQIGLAYYGPHNVKEYSSEKNDLVHSLDLLSRLPEASEAHRKVATRMIEELFGAPKGERVA
jgi:hypothetical protein